VDLTYITVAGAAKDLTLFSRLTVFVSL